MAGTESKIEAELDLIHVWCGQHCRFISKNEAEGVIFYQCFACNRIFMVGEYHESSAEGDTASQPAGEAAIQIDQTQTPPQEEKPQEPKPHRKRKAERSDIELSY